MSGFDWQGDFYKSGSGGAGGRANSGGSRYRNLIVAPGEKRVVLVLDGSPEALFAHKMYGFSKARGLGLKASELPICLDQDGAGGTCPICKARGMQEEKDGSMKEGRLSRAQRFAYLPVIDMGLLVMERGVPTLQPSEWNGKRFQFGMNIAMVPFGTKNKPGQIMALAEMTRSRAVAKNGGLRGVLCKVERAGKNDAAVWSQFTVPGVDSEGNDTLRPVILNGLPADAEAGLEFLRDFVKSNAGTGKLFGKDSIELVNSNWTTLVPPDKSQWPFYTLQEMLLKYSLNEDGTSSRGDGGSSERAGGGTNTGRTTGVGSVDDGDGDEIPF